MKAQRYSLLLGSFLGMASCSYGASVHVPPALQNFEKSVENAQHALVAFEQNPSVQSYRHVRSVLEAAKRNLTTLTEKFEVARRTNASWRGIPVLVQVHNDLPRYQEQFDVLESRVSAVLEGWLTRTQKAAEAVSMPAPVSQEPQPKKRTVKPVLSKKKVKAVKKKGKGIGAPVIPIPVDLATHQELAVLRQQVASLTQALEVLRATHAKELDDIEQQYRRRPYDGRGPADERIAQIKREAEHALAQAHTQAQAAQQQLQDDYVRLQQQLHSRGATEQELRQQLATLQQRRQEDQAHHAKALEQAHAEVAQKIQHALAQAQTQADEEQKRLQRQVQEREEAMRKLQGDIDQARGQLADLQSRSTAAQAQTEQQARDVREQLKKEQQHHQTELEKNRREAAKFRDDTLAHAQGVLREESRKHAQELAHIEQQNTKLRQEIQRRIEQFRDGYAQLDTIVQQRRDEDRVREERRKQEEERRNQHVKELERSIASLSDRIDRRSMSADERSRLEGQRSALEDQLGYFKQGMRQEEAARKAEQQAAAAAKHLVTPALPVQPTTPAEQEFSLGQALKGAIAGLQDLLRKEEKQVPAPQPAVTPVVAPAPVPVAPHPAPAPVVAPAAPPAPAGQPAPKKKRERSEQPVSQQPRLEPPLTAR